MTKKAARGQAGAAPERAAAKPPTPTKAPTPAKGGAGRSPTPPERTGPGEGVDHQLLLLQRQIGNRGVDRYVQRATQTGALAALATPKDRAEALARAGVADLLDTAFDPAFAKPGRAPELAAAVAALPDQDRRRVALALRAAFGPYDEPFYYDVGLVDAPARDAIWDRLRKQKPSVANPTARSAAMLGALAGFIRSAAYGSAFRMLNGYGMPDILELLVTAHGGGLVAELEAHWADASGVDVARLQAAVKAVRLLELYRALDIRRAPLAPMDAAVDRTATDRYEKTLDDQLAAPEPYPGYHAKIRASKAFLAAARADIDQFALAAVGLSVPDKAAVNDLFADVATADFAGTLGDPQAMGGQFVLSSALQGAVQAVLTAQYGKLPLTAAEKADLDAADQKLSTAVESVSAYTPGPSYGAVHVAAVALGAKAKKLAAAHGVALDPDFTACLRRAVGPPPAAKAYSAILAQVFQPLWKTWLDTGSFPPVSGFRNVYQLAYLKMADQWACQPMTMNLAKLYHLKAGSRPKDPKAALPMTALSTGTTVTRDGRGRIVDERVTYRKDLVAVMEKIRVALDGGWLVHVRVLSGVAMDNTASRAAAEHSLLVVGHAGNTLQCADTDPGGEGALHLMGGTTQLFFDPGSNTLASAYGTAAAVDAHGFQANRRHRYQAWSVQSV